MDLGANLRGVDMGPSALRIARLPELLLDMGLDVHDAGNIEVTPVDARSADAAKRSSRPCRPWFVKPIAQTCQRLRDKVAEVLRTGGMPLVIGGDHSVAIGSIAGLVHSVRRTGKRFGLLWVDAHGDCNTPQTSPSGNVHGMALAIVLGRGPRALTDLAGIRPMILPEKTVLFGVRELDRLERNVIRGLGLRVFTMREIDERGVPVCMREALSILADGTDGIHFSFDIDSMDPINAPGIGTPVIGGLTAREAFLIMEMMADSNHMTSLDIVEVNPALDHRNATARLAVDLACSGIGASIL
jgi:arginase